MYHLLYNMLRVARLTNIPPFRETQCRACGGRPIRGSRTVCITCGMTDPVNLCDKVQCLTMPVYHNRTFPHRPSHDILKLRTAIHPILEYKETYCSAQSASEKLRQIFADLPSRGSGKGGKQPVPQCVMCHGYVRFLPCWYCIECEGTSSRLRTLPVRSRVTLDIPGNVYICVSCEAKYGGITVGDHQDSHAIVQCQHTKSPVDLECEPSMAHYSCMNERRQPIDEFLHHPLKAAGALGSKAAASLQNACVHA